MSSRESIRSSSDVVYLESVSSNMFLKKSNSQMTAVFLARDVWPEPGSCRCGGEQLWTFSIAYSGDGVIAVFESCFCCE